MIDLVIIMIYIHNGLKNQKPYIRMQLMYKLILKNFIKKIRNKMNVFKCLEKY